MPDTKIRNLPVTGSLDDDDCFVVATYSDTKTSKVKWSDMVSGLGSGGAYAPFSTIYYTDGANNWLLQPGTYTLGVASGSATGTINIVGGSGSYTWQAEDRVYVQVNATNGPYTSNTTPKLLSSNYTEIHNFHYKLKINESNGQITTASRFLGNGAHWSSLTFTIWRKS